MTRNVEKRFLRPGEAPPETEPRRYPSSHGYILLRWKVGPSQYLETYEHRLVAGIPAGPVHHEDRDKANNDPANLTPKRDDAEHAREHRRIDRKNAVAVFRQAPTVEAAAETLGCSPSHLGRILRAEGVDVPRPTNRIEVNDAALAALCAEGRSAHYMADALGVSVHVVRNRMRDAGIRNRRVGRPGNQESDPLAKETRHGTTARYRQGCTCADCRAANARAEAERRAPS